MNGWPQRSAIQCWSFGHTHKPWAHSYGGVLLVNCGSVDKSKDGDTSDAFAILQPAKDTVEVTIERVDYDADAVAAPMVLVLSSRFSLNIVAKEEWSRLG